MKPIHVGDRFRIRPRYDKGGFKVIEVTRVHGRHVWVIDLLDDGRPASAVMPERKERRFYPPGGARVGLAKCWTREGVMSVKKGGGKKGGKKGKGY